MEPSPAGARVGGTFGPYELRSLLGHGGMGEVYEAYDTVKDRTVALKLLSGALALDPSYQERFRRESRAAARLQEPHVIPIHDWGEIDGVLFIDMRLVHGRDLRAVIREDGPLAPSQAADVISQIASALDAAHADGLVHRDVKPENILLTAQGFAYLVDFGIAHSTSDGQLTTQGSAIGSYAYMAPERFDVGNVDGAADTYSLACVLHEALTGEQPFPRGTASQLIKSHVMSPPPRPSQHSGVPAAFDAVIAAGMAKQPRARYPSAGALADAAHAALSPRGKGAAPAIAGHTLVGETLPPAEYSDPWRTAPPPSGQPYPGQHYGWQQYAGPQHHGQPYPAPPYGQAPYARPRKSPAVPIALTLLAVLIIGLGGAVAWVAMTKNSSADVANSARSNAGDDAAAAATSAATRPTTPTATVTTTVQPPSTRVTAPPTRPAPSRDVGVSGADGQGFLGNSSARCNGDNPAVAIARTTKSYVVVCVTGVGRYYYKGFRNRDGAAIEIDDPVPTSSGFVATSDGTEYRLDSSALTMTNAGEVLGTEPVIEYYIS